MKGGVHLEDKKIVELYLLRDEKAITESKRKYGQYCYAIAYRLLQNRMDAQECENDTYLGAWNAIPPHQPQNLGTFLGKIVRHISIKCYQKNHAQRRGGGSIEVALDDLKDCLAHDKTLDEELENRQIGVLIDAFLRTLPKAEREVFLLRYWYMDSIKEICAALGYGESKVKMMLLRTREKLLYHLEKEGIYL